ncbi:MAG: hypothetical protein IPJ81_19275 [Chitinophagaceae bacterium]|nr:hypothetical protein [Chitinophagaceae bacterium]
MYTFIYSFFCYSKCSKKRCYYTKDLQLLPGQWTGNLVYTDYKDDSTLIKLKLNLSITATTGENFSLKSEYTEPNGEIVKDSSSLFIDDSASEVTYGGDIYSILKVRRTGSQLIIVTTMDGKDNNQDAEIRHTFNISARQFIILKEVRYLDKAEKFFTRHKLVVIK